MAGVKGKGGKKGRSGRKPKQHEISVQQLMDKCWKQADREAMVAAWAARASQGDLEAGKLLMAYTFGKPTEHHEHTGKDGGAIEHKTTVILNFGKKDGDRD